MSATPVEHRFRLRPVSAGCHFRGKSSSPRWGRSRRAASIALRIRYSVRGRAAGSVSDRVAVVGEPHRQPRTVSAASRRFGLARQLIDPKPGGGAGIVLTRAVRPPGAIADRSVFRRAWLDRVSPRPLCRLTRSRARGPLGAAGESRPPGPLVHPSGERRQTQRLVDVLRSSTVGDGVAAAVPASLLSGLPSTLHALATGRDPLKATAAAGSILLPGERRTGLLLAAAVPAHLALSLGWSVALAHLLPIRGREPPEPSREPR